ncbi:MAG: hypothetical protein OXG27_14725, partial [Chloroflexi bacterium]|nr:hypothetical protein [Chloroflexota bacterium]
MPRRADRLTRSPVRPSGRLSGRLAGLSVVLALAVLLLVSLSPEAARAQTAPTVTMTLSSDGTSEGDSGLNDVTVTLDFANLNAGQTNVNVCLSGTAISGGLYRTDLPPSERNT